MQNENHANDKLSKDDISLKIDRLKRAISTRGRRYSAIQRAEMRKELEQLYEELGNIELIESIDFIKEFENKHPLKLKPERESLKSKMDDLLNEVNDFKLRYILDFKTQPLYKELEYLESSYTEIESLRAALDFIESEKKLTEYGCKPHFFEKVDKIQRNLSANYVSMNAKIDKLSKSIAEIGIIKEFFLTDNRLKAFVYLSEALFTEVSDFTEGYGNVAQGSKKMYFSYKGEAYKSDNSIDGIPKIRNERLNPDLIPFEIGAENFNTLWGYKNNKGEIIIPPKYPYAFPFLNGFAKVGILKKDLSKHTYGLIDESGKEILPCDFIELGYVYNDVVWYKKHLFKSEYVRVSSFDFIVKEETRYLGLYGGYLIIKELKPIIYDEVEQIFKIENEMKNLKTNGEIDNANEQIQGHKGKIKFYLTQLLNIL